jgi:hypothetical protein
MTQYVVIHEDQVQKYLDDGWELYGSPMVYPDDEDQSQPAFFQAVVKVSKQFIQPKPKLHQIQAS